MIHVEELFWQLNRGVTVTSRGHALLAEVRMNTGIKVELSKPANAFSWGSYMTLQFL